ncbi:MAG: glycine/sarcosine/betaine reductase selenoprotein B family protein, partial [Fusobacteriaceae bacterium]
MKIVKGMQSEIFVPITPNSIFTQVTKELKNMKIALATAAGVHMKTDERFNFAGDFSFRLIPGNAKDEEMMVSHGGYDNADVNKDINCMFPLARLRELKETGLFKEVAETHIGFM